MTGVARKIKEKIRNCKVIAVDPHGSMQALPKEKNLRKCPFQIEGIGHDFIPRVMDREIVDDWIKIDDTESFLMARRIIKEEGLIIGGSSGGMLSAAIRYAKEKNLGEDVRICIILPDSIRNYITKFVSDEWMVDKGHILPSEIVEKNHILKGIPLDALKNLK